MSMVRCGRCDRLVDSDDDCECFVESAEGDQILCEHCRDKLDVPSAIDRIARRVPGQESFASFVARMEQSQRDNPEEWEEG